MRHIMNATRATSLLAVAAAVAMPLAACGQQPQSQTQQQTQQTAQDDQQQSQQKEGGEQDGQQEKQADQRKLQVFQLKHRDPQHLGQLIGLAEQAAAQGESFNLVTAAGQPLGSGFGGRIVTGYRGTPDSGAKENRLVTSIDAEKQILFVRGTDDQLAKIKELVSKFDVEDQQLQRHTYGSLRLIPVHSQDSGRVRNTLTQLELPSGMLTMGQVSLVVFHETSGDKEKIAQAEQVIDALSSQPKQDEKEKEGDQAQPKPDAEDAPKSQQGGGGQSQQQQQQ